MLILKIMLAVLERNNFARPCKSGSCFSGNESFRFCSIAFSKIFYLKKRIMEFFCREFLLQGE